MILLTLCLSAVSMIATSHKQAKMLQAVRQVLPDDGSVQRVMNSEHMAVYSRQAGGFAVVTDDGRLVAYSPSARLDPRSANPGFAWWWRLAQKVGSKASENATTPPDTERFAPRIDSLVTSLWGQGRPFNGWCPTDDGEICDDYSPNVAHCWVGCVATAVAQVVRYYRYPASASGEADFFIGDKPVRTAFEGTYDWNELIDYYSEGYTEAQGRAAALLNYHCGLISMMNYASDASGSSNQNAINGMVKFFGYSNKMHYVVRSDYSEPEWMEMVYTELNQGRPIIYTGVQVDFSLGIVGGHSFIIDGYDENGLVHVNWGWQGTDNGFYDIALLNPQIYELNDYQDMVLGIEPAVSQTVGDVNNDGKVDISDVNAIINVMLGNSSQAGVASRADVNGDGKADISDVNIVINIMFGKQSAPALPTM